MLSIIAAVDQNNAIGYQNRLLCHLPNDLKYFKKITSGHPIIMGRKTYDSLLIKPLPNRTNIVISKSIDSLSGCIVVKSIDEAIGKCPSDEECFVAGGAQVYEQMIALVQKLYITRIHHAFKADTYFPEILPDQWQLFSSESHESDEKHPYAYSFEVYSRR